MRHVMMDTRTGQVVTVGRDGARYSPTEIEEAERAAAAGDAAAQAVMKNIDLTDDFADRDPRDVMRQLVHDCPECRAATAALGLPPLIGTGEDLFGASAARTRKPRHRRWREQRRRSGRGSGQ
jgi:hypothetical protein